MDGEVIHPHPGPDERGDHRLDVAWGADADGVTEGELLTPHLKQPTADADDLVDRHRALPRVAPAHRHVPTHAKALGAGPTHHRIEHGELPVQGLVEVAGGEALRGRGEDRDVGDPGPQRSVQPAIVGHQQRQQLLGVGELGHPPRVPETRRLQHAESRPGQPVEELGLHGDVHDRGLVLQAVAGTDLPDRHPRRQPVTGVEVGQAQCARHRRHPASRSGDAGLTCR